MKVIATERIPIKMWFDSADDTATEQARNLANLPFSHKHIALMPDCHQGYGMPIGGVLATKGVIIPNAVGVDIGCGMCAIKTNINTINQSVLKTIVAEIQKQVPVGFKWHDKPAEEIDILTHYDRLPVVQKQYERSRYQLGTLGGGNHFIELQQGSDGCVWVMVHSGSRNLGKQVADHYNKVAVKLNEQWCSSVPKKWELAFLPINTKEAKNYREEMDYCVLFAFANRGMIMQRIIDIIKEHVADVEFEPMINIAHNYAVMENHFGSNVMVHRKGATQAREGYFGIIPGSQGTCSYIVRGKGNEESFKSCSHGAGRRMGRRQAKRELDLAEQRGVLDKKGIIHSMTTENDLDEAPGAYKDIDVVMAQQTDLVDIDVRLSPLAVIKG